MNAYLFVASVTRFRVAEPDPARGAAANQRQLWTSGLSSMVCADSAEEAEKRFEAWACAPPEGDSGIESRINKMTAAQFVDQLLTETKPVAADWRQIATQAQLDLEATAAEDFEQGYWLDVNGVIPPSASLEDLRRELPEDISSGLNWAAEKQFFFLFSVLSPPPPPAPEPWEAAEGGADEAAERSEGSAEEADPVLAEALAEFPQLADKEAAALIRARNSAVAAWLWRKYAAETRLARNQIRIDPWCGVLGLEANRDPDAVIAECTKAIELKPDDAASYLDRGSAKETKKDLDGAIADFTKAIELKSDHVYGAYYNRGKAKDAKGDYEGAIADCTEAIALKPDFALGYIGRGVTKHRKGDLDGAIADYSQAIELDPNNAYAFNNRSITRLVQGDLEGAFADTNKAIELKPDFADAYSNRGVAKRVGGDVEGALADYMKALELYPKSAPAYLARGCLRYDTQEFKDALVDFRKVLELDDTQKAHAYFRIWLIRTRMGEAEAASAELQTYLDSRASGKADDWVAEIGRFLCGQLAEAEFLASAKNADPRTEAGQLCQAYFYAGSKRLFSGDQDAAVECFQKSIATEQKAYTEYGSAAAELENLKTQEG